MTKRKITSSRKSKMAGSALAISTTNKESANHACDEWQIEYARFVNCSSFAFNSTHPSLVPVPKPRLRGAWISSSISASVKLIYDRTSSGTDDAVLVLSLRSKTLVSLKISSSCLISSENSSVVCIVLFLLLIVGCCARISSIRFLFISVC